MKSLKIRLSLMNFLEFAVWGSYLTSLGNFLGKESVGLGPQIGWFYVVQGIVSLFMPSVIGIIADRWIQAQRMLSLSHLLAGVFMASAACYCWLSPEIQFGPLFTLYTLSVAFFMPTIGLANSVAFNALTRNGMDTIKDFPPIRIWGTIGFICAMLLVNFLSIDGAAFQTSYMQLFTSAIFSLLLAAYALTMPKCPVSKGVANGSVSDALDLRAFKLFKRRRMAIFFLFSMLLGVSLQITNGYANPYITGFESIDIFSDAWAARNANALISLSQISETLCILLIPFFLKRFGIKGVMLMSMFAWVFRFGFFGLGNPAGGLWMFILSCIVYGIAFDFFNVSGGLYVDKETSPDIRSSAQGLFMIMTNGFGATIGTFAAMQVVNHFVYSIPETDVMSRLDGWRTCWFIFAAYALVVAVLFIFIFKDDKKELSQNVAGAEDTQSGSGGMVSGSVPGADFKA